MVISDRNGVISQINNRNINSLTKILGAPQDKFAGIEMYKKVKEEIKKGEPFIRLFSSNQYKLDEAIESISYLPIYSYLA
jgi:AMP phosphorylase